MLIVTAATDLRNYTRVASAYPGFVATADEFGVETVHCYEAVWTDRLGERRSIVVLPRRGEPAQAYVARHVPWIVHQGSDSYSWAWDVNRDPYDPAVMRRSAQRRRAKKKRGKTGVARIDLEAWHITISRGVSITASPAEAGAYADAADVMLTVVGRTDAAWTTAGVRAGRWWNAFSPSGYASGRGAGTGRPWTRPHGHTPRPSATSRHASGPRSPGLSGRHGAATRFPGGTAAPVGSAAAM